MANDTATRDDIRELASVGRDMADAMTRIAVGTEAGSQERAVFRDRQAHIEELLRPVAVYFEAQNAANARAAAEHLEADGRFRATAKTWFAWLTPTRAVAIIVGLSTLLPALGLGTGLAGRAQRVVDALSATADSGPASVVIQTLPAPVAPTVVVAPVEPATDSPPPEVTDGH